MFEVDLAPLSRRKRAIVSAHPDAFQGGRVTSVEIDFRTQSLAERLTESGFRTGARTFVVWEGVSMYLSRAALTGTLAELASSCGPGSVLAMDFWQPVRGARPYDQVRRVGQRAMGLIGEPITLSVADHAVGELLGTAGFHVIDLATADAMTARYATAGRRCDEAMYVVAAQLVSR